jgi:hypothetical protein
MCKTFGKPAETRPLSKIGDVIKKKANFSVSRTSYRMKMVFCYFWSISANVAGGIVSADVRLSVCHVDHTSVFHRK